MDVSLIFLHKQEKYKLETRNQPNEEILYQKSYQ